MPRFATGKVVDYAQDVDQEVKLSKTSSTVVAVEARANLKVDSFLVFIPFERQAQGVGPTHIPTIVGTIYTSKRPSVCLPVCPSI